VNTLAPALTALRLSLHVLAATVWVGGQITLAGTLPTLRSLGGDATARVARAFARLSWPAFGVLVLTGIWNVSAVHASHATSAWTTVLFAKIVVVALAGVAAALHQWSRSRRGLAAWGSVAGTTSVAAVVLGVLLSG
jgi:putative copper export protein